MSNEKKTPDVEEVKPSAEQDVVETKATETADAEKPADKPKKKRFGKKQKDESEMTEEEKKEAEAKRKRAERNKPKDIKKSAKRLIKYITAYKGRLVIVAFLVILSTAISAVSALIMQPIYGAIEKVINGASTRTEQMPEIIKYLIVMTLAYLSSSVMSYLYQRIMLKMSIHVLTDMRRELFNHIQTLPISFFDKRKTGVIMSHFTNDIGMVSDLVQSTFINLISSTIQAVMTITIMIVYSWRITLTLTVAVALMFGTVMIITNICRPLFKAQQKNLAAVNGYLEEYTRGIKVVQIFSHQEIAKKEFFDLVETYRKTGIKANVIGGFTGPIVSMISRVNYAVAVGIGAYQVVKGKGNMDIPKLVVYLNYVSSYGSPVVSIASCYSSLISALAGAERVFEVLDMEAETDEGKITLARKLSEMMEWEDATEDKNGEGELAWRVPQEDGTFKYIPVKCVIDVEDVSFEYVEDKPVLKHVTAHAGSGEKLAFVGSTGAGKTTITNLINRFYEINEGSIKVDGIDIRDIKKDALRSTMAFVLQDTRLFAGSIAENIRYGRLNATDEEIREAARISNAADFINKLPDGYDSQIRADGVNLSIGQAQLINIARAAVSKRPILVLDEATSSVDTRTERLIEVGMDTLMEEKTVLVIAHRLSTVRNSDDIVVLEDGEIIEEGNHDALIALAGKYYQLYTGKFELK